VVFGFSNLSKGGVSGFQTLARVEFRDFGLEQGWGSGFRMEDGVMEEG